MSQKCGNKFLKMSNFIVVYIISFNLINDIFWNVQYTNNPKKSEIVFISKNSTWPQTKLNDVSKIHCLNLPSGCLQCFFPKNSIDRLIFVGLSNRLGLFYTKRLGNCVHRTFTLYFLLCFLRAFEHSYMISSIPIQY